MKRILLLLSIHLSLAALLSAQDTGMHFRSSDLQFRSSDTLMQQAFTWAKAMALHYRGQPGDPVGPWYESALPPRYAFCMRDVSHQCIGAEILGMHRENQNMFSKFTTNISAAKDWCSYWEIDKYDRPSPADYRSDREFWYNLNANFDLLDACWRTYLWTGDTIYLKDPAFLNFYARSAGEYISKWTLQPDSLLIRPAYPNAPVPFNIEDAFNRCRGLPSYSEGIHNLKMGVDLVGALYRGLQSYAAILQTNGDLAASTRCRESSTPYRDRIETDWWDEKAGLYHTHYTNDRQFGKAEGETFLLWFDVLQDTTRKKKTIGHLLTMDLNVENLSYLPLQYYRNGYWSQAHDLILHLADPATARREYPEVSYGVIEAMVQGLIGVDANAVTRTVSTLYRSDNKASAQLTGLPVFNTTLTVTHFGSTRSAIVNTGKHPFIWRARFSGDYKEAIVNSSLAGKGLPGKLRGSKLNQEKDRDGHLISWLEMEVAPGKKLNVRVR